MVIIQYGNEAKVSGQVFKLLCTAIVFNAIWLLVQSVFKEVRVQERSAQTNEMSDAVSMASVV